jgi:hypothetical protein
MAEAPAQVEPVVAEADDAPLPEDALQIDVRVSFKPSPGGPVDSLHDLTGSRPRPNLLTRILPTPRPSDLQARP